MKDLSIADLISLREYICHAIYGKDFKKYSQLLPKIKEEIESRINQLYEKI